MDGTRERSGRLVGWALVVAGGALTLLSFVDRPPSGDAFVKQEPERIERVSPATTEFRFVPAPYPYDRKPWPYRREAGGGFVYVGDKP